MISNSSSASQYNHHDGEQDNTAANKLICYQMISSTKYSVSIERNASSKPYELRISRWKI